jgi:hypothetical protein
MTVTDEMVEAAMPFINITYADSEMKARAILEAALSTIKPMTANEIDSMMQRGCIDDTVDLVEAVEYWHGIRE